MPELIGCHIHDVGGGGVCVAGGATPTVTDCRIERVGWAGLSIGGQSSGGTAVRTEITAVKGTGVQVEAGGQLGGPVAEARRDGRATERGRTRDRAGGNRP